MIKTLYLLALSAILFSCSSKQGCDIQAIDGITIEGQNIKIYDYESIAPLLSEGCETTHVINFWATWCKPCVAELPYFEKLTAEGIKVTLVSLDMPSMIDTHLIPFLNKENIKSEVVVLNDPDANSWISKVDPNWSGAIPSTIFFKNNKRAFYEQSFNYESLLKTLNQL